VKDHEPGLFRFGLVGRHDLRVSLRNDGLVRGNVERVSDLMGHDDRRHMLQIAQLDDFVVDDIIVPLIKYEGGPRQVAARQLLSTSEQLSPNETAYLDATIGKKGAPFNRIKEGSKISSVAELQRSKDADLLLVGMELFGYDLQIYQELDRLLGTRNDSAHPGMAQPGVLDVRQFATKVNGYVFQLVKV